MSNLFNCLAEGIDKIKCNCGHDNKKCEMRGIKYKDCGFCLEYANVKDNLIKKTDLCCNKNYPKMFDEILKNRFVNANTNFKIHTSFLTMILITLFYFCQKVFTLINT